MAKKWHIKPDGTPGICTAKEGNCPYGEASQHYSSKEFAETAAQEILQQKFGYNKKQVAENMNFTMNLPNDVKMIIDRLEAKGFQGFAVGGCVRDSLLGLIPHDWDIATDATVNQGRKKVFKNFNAAMTGEKHGTWTLILEDDQYEITTFRNDGDYSDNRHPDEVVFIDSIEEDLARRDFTVNAMAFNSTEGLVDPFNGQEDLANKVIRAVGNPHERFTEDALRIMRALRFAAVYGFEIEENTAQAMKDCRHLLANVSAERISVELSKLLQGKNLDKLLIQHKEVLFEVIPELKTTDGFNQYNKWHNFDVFTHSVKAVEFSENVLPVRLAMLLHDVGKPTTFTLDEEGTGHFYGHAQVGAEQVEEILRRLKFDNNTRETVVLLVSNHDVQFTASKKQVRRFLSKFGEKKLRFLVDCRVADTLAHSELSMKFLPMLEEVKGQITELVESEECFSLRKLAVNGKDLIEAGFVQGKAVGEMLQTLLSKVIDEELNNDKEELLEFVRKSAI
jgi:tRNA nucleotidyltransferase (CCA-adding enzyme)